MGLEDRRERLLPDGVPRYVWCYDDGGVTAERYTAVFTGFLSIKKPGEYPYLTMNAAPVRVGDGGTSRRGRPPIERLRREIRFQDLPKGCRRLVLDAYEELWRL